MTNKKDELLLTDISMKDGGLDVTIEGGMCGVVADAFANQFKDNGGVNFITMGFHNEELGNFTVTVQKDSGEPIADKMHAMQKRIDELEGREKAAFWWSAEFTGTVHGNKVQQAWEDYSKLKQEFPK